jgi:hypothetical protein
MGLLPIKEAWEKQQMLWKNTGKNESILLGISTDSSGFI